MSSSITTTTVILRWQLLLVSSYINKLIKRKRYIITLLAYSLKYCEMDLERSFAYLSSMECVSLLWCSMLQLNSKVFHSLTALSFSKHTHYSHSYLFSWFYWPAPSLVFLNLHLTSHCYYHCLHYLTFPSNHYYCYYCNFFINLITIRPGYRLQQTNDADELFLTLSTPIPYFPCSPYLVISAASTNYFLFSFITSTSLTIHSIGVAPVEFSFQAEHYSISLSTESSHQFSTVFINLVRQKCDFFLNQTPILILGFNSKQGQKEVLGFLCNSKWTTQQDWH